MDTEPIAGRIGLSRSIGLGLAAVVGSGIFVLPAYVARQLPAPRDFLLIWPLGALVALASALSYAELAAVFPRTGGYVVYLRRIWGRQVAFVYGWAAILVLYPASIAALARISGRSAAALLSLPGGDGRLAALAVLVAVAVNLARVRISSRVQGVLGGLKLAALLALGVAGLWLRAAPQAADATLRSAAEVAGGGVGAWALALVGVLWCYEGFLEIVVVAGEIDRPARTVVRALVTVVVAVGVVYAIYTFALVKVLGVGAIASSPTVAAELARSVFPVGGEVMIHLLVAVATFSAAQALLFSAPRLLVGLAEEGVIPAALGRWSGRHRIPRVAILLCGAVSLVYTATGSFEELVKYFAFATGLFSALILAGGLRLRMSGAVAAGLRRIPLWPLPPLLAMAASLAATGWVLVDQPRSSLVGLAIMALSWPLSSLVGPHRR